MALGGGEGGEKGCGGAAGGFSGDFGGTEGEEAGLDGPVRGDAAKRFGEAGFFGGEGALAESFVGDLGVGDEEERGSEEEGPETWMHSDAPEPTTSRLIRRIDDSNRMPSAALAGQALDGGPDGFADPPGCREANRKGEREASTGAGNCSTGDVEAALGVRQNAGAEEGPVG